MADLLRASDGAVRAADVLLRGAGGRAVQLRLPVPAIPGDASEQLGLAVPEFQDVELAAVTIYGAKSSGGKTEMTRRMLVSAKAVSGIVGSLGYSAASVLFQVAYGVLVDGVLLEVMSATEWEVSGVPYVYQLILRVPAALTV